MLWLWQNDQVAIVNIFILRRQKGGAKVKSGLRQLAIAELWFPQCRIVETND